MDVYLMLKVRMAAKSLLGRAIFLERYLKAKI